MGLDLRITLQILEISSQLSGARNVKELLIRRANTEARTCHKTQPLALATGSRTITSDPNRTQ